MASSRLTCTSLGELVDLPANGPVPVEPELDPREEDAVEPSGEGWLRSRSHWVGGLGSGMDIESDLRGEEWRIG